MNNNINEIDKLLRTLKAMSVKLGIYFPTLEYRILEAGEKMPSGSYVPLSFNLIVFDQTN